MRWIIAFVALVATVLPASALCPLPSGCYTPPPPVRVPIQRPPQVYQPQPRYVPQQQVVPQPQHIQPQQQYRPPVQQRSVPQPQQRQVVPQQRHIVPHQQVVPQHRVVPQVHRHVHMQRIQTTRSMHHRVYVHHRELFTVQQAPIVHHIEGRAVPWVVFTVPNGRYFIHDDIRYYGWVGVRPSPSEDLIWVMMDDRYINMGGTIPSIYEMLKSGDTKQLNAALALVWGSAQMQGLVPMEFDENNSGD